jgi:hypothetical protein
MRVICKIRPQALQIALVIESKLYPYYINKLDEEQTRFQKEEYCSDAYFTLKTLVENTKI